MNWIEKEERGINVFFFILRYAFLSLISSSLILIIYLSLDVRMKGPEVFSLHSGQELVWILTIMAFIEEAIFRLPLVIFIRRNWSPKSVLIIAVILSVIFGLFHAGIQSLPMQGVSGFLLSLVFLKCGGLQRKFFKAYLSSTAAHLISNLVIATVTTVAS